MSLLTEKKYSFTSSAKGTTKDTFTVTSFKGSEAISRPYEFEIMLVSDNMDVDPATVLQNPAKFTIHREAGGDVDFNGILAQFEELKEFQGYIFFRALLVPKLWWLSLTHHNQVCLDNSVSEIIENALKDGGLLQNLDFDFSLQNIYSKFDYVCQYGETHFNFVSRWAEREGIYYFFEQGKKGEKILFTDTKIAHPDLPLEATLYYSPPSGLDSEHLSEVVKSFTCRHQMVPQRVFLKDYNYERPSLGIEGSAVVDKNGRGEKYIYGEYFSTPEEGNRLANIRAEELLCRKVQFFGESSVPFMMPGYTFKLNDHYRDSYNSRYLITEVTHEGHQTGFLFSGIKEGLTEQEQKMSYQNSFTAIPADVQFRPERTSEKPKVSGTIHARVDAEGDGQYAELDDHGRYKIKLPFDVNSDHMDGKASAYVRMIQPYAGEDMGMHFPLHKGAEVLLTFVDGDPDRPIIAGAVPNPETASPVSAVNQSESVIQTGGSNKIRIEDKIGTERIIMETPTGNSWFRIGAPNDPPKRLSALEKSLIKDIDPTDGIRIYTEGDFVEEAEDNFELRVGKKYEENIGVTTSPDTSYDFGDPPPDKGVFVNGTYEKITADKYTEQIGVSSSKDAHDFSSTDPMKGVYVNGNNEVVVSGDSTILARKDGNELKIEMKDGELLIDSGNNLLKLNGRELLKEIDEDENNIIWGSSYEHFGGAKAETFMGAKFEAALAETLEIFVGAKREISLGMLLEVFLGMKLELALSLSVIIAAGAEVKIHGPVEFEKEGVKLVKSETKLENDMIKIATDTLQLNFCNLNMIG